jgi:hypothetical protein
VLADLAVAALLGAMLITAVTAWRGSRLGAIVLALQSVAWLSVNQASEAPVLITFSNEALLPLVWAGFDLARGV